MADDLELKDISTFDKIKHKNWKVRVVGYEDLLMEMKMLESVNDPFYNRLLELIKQMVNDGNAFAQEKSLEAILYFVQFANVATKLASDICSGIINRCISSNRNRTKELSFEILKTYIEMEKQNIVFEELVKGLNNNKNLKVIIGSINVLTESLHDFGPKIVPVKELFKNVHKLLEDRDKNVRDAGKELIIEMYRWLGSSTMGSVLNQLKPVQVTELNAEFDKLPKEKPVPCRYLKSQKPKEGAIVKPTGGGDAVSQQTAAKVQNNVDIDPYDLLDPVEVISKIPANYYDQIEEKKWTDRKEALEVIEKLTNHGKLVPGEYGDLMKSLLKVLSKDTNIVLVALSGKIIYQIATGLRKKFSPYAVTTIQVCLEKFKEKKANVVKALRDSVDAAFAATTFDACMEEIINALNHKTPSVKSETAHFLTRVFQKSTTESWTGKLLKQIIPPLTNLCLDSVPEVRDAAFESLGTAMKVVTEKKLKPYLDKMDNVKLARINEFYEKAKQEPENPVVTASKDPPVTVVKNVPEPAKVEKPTEVAKKPVQSKPPTKKPAGKSQKPAATSKVPEIPTEPVMSDDDVTLKATELFGETLMTQLVDKNWKERSCAFEALQKHIKSQTPSEIPCQLIIRLILLKPGLKDNNNQVLKLKIELIKEIVMNGKLTWTVAEMCIADLTEKIGDIKNSENVKSTLTEMSDAINLQLIANQVIKTASENVNVKNLVEALNWLSDAIKDFGFKIPINDLVPFIRLAVQHTNPAVRQSGIKLAGTISLYVRDVISTLLKDEKASVKQLIDTEVESLKSVNPPAPTRGLKNEPSVAETANDSEIVTGPVVQELELDDMIPRENISHKITENLLAQLADKANKIKRDALDEVTKIISAPVGISGEGLQSLITVISKSTNDSSMVVSKMAISILVTLGNALNKKDAERYIKLVIPALFASCSDPKPKNREDAVAALNIWTEKVGFPNVVDGGMLTEGLKVDNPFQKATILAWIAPHLTKLSQNKAAKKLLYPDFASEILPHLYSAIEERSPDVRKSSQDAVLPFMLVLGYDVMVKNYKNNSKTASKNTVMGFLDKAKLELPAPDPAANKQAAKPASSNAKPPSAKESSNKRPSDAPSKTKKEDSKKNAKSTNKANDQSEKEGVIVALLSKTSNKKQRIQEDKKKKITKWETNIANSQQLNAQFSTSCSPELLQLLFTNDLKKSIKAIELMNNFLSEEDKDSIDATRQNLDLILKWMVIRFNETNPSVLIKGLDYLYRVFTILCMENSFQLLEQEAVGFIPELIIKMGDAKDQIRIPSQKILKLISNCYDNLKIVLFLEENLANKTARVRQECADFLKFLIDERKIDVLNQKNLLKSVALLISERDNSVRTAALNCLVSAHNFMGEDLLKTLDSLHDKDRSMLLERIKRTGKPVSSETESSQSTITVEKNHKLSKPRESSASREQSKPQMQLPVQKSIDINPLLKEEIGYKLINVDKEIEELLQPLEKLTLRFSGRASQTINSNDAITSVIHAINSTDLQTSIQAMAQIDEVIRNQDVRSQLINYMDNLVMSITMQLKATLGKLSEEKFSESEITDMFKGMLATLVSIFNAKELACELNRDRLMNLMQSILRIVINDQLVSLSEGGTIIRGINILSVRILESSNQTRMLSALLRMMSDCLKNGDTNSKYLNLIFKCIWSMTKNLVNTVNTIDLVVILKDIHAFYTDFPPHVWEARESGRDVPLRTVKTLVYSIINNRNGGVLEALYQIPNAPHKDLDTYIRKSYAKLNVPIPTVMPSPPDNSVVTEAPAPASNKTKFAFKSNSRPYLDELKEIFGKIGNPDQNKQGLNDLFDFRQKYPYVDLSRYLAQSTPYFQKTIETGLKNIADERGQATLPVYGSNQFNNSGATASLDKDNLANCNMDPEALLLRLKQLRKNAGLDKSHSEKIDQNRTTSPVKEEMEISVISKLVPSGDGPVEPSPNNQMNNKRKMSAVDLAAFKQRIEAIKRPN